VLKTSRTRRVFGRLKRLWGEMNYAQRRSFELRTGVPAGAAGHPHISRSVDELERLLAA
jgi:hypothetical protein